MIAVFTGGLTAQDVWLVLRVVGHLVLSCSMFTLCMSWVNSHNGRSHNYAYSEYKHVLANILHSRYVARTPPLEARSAGRRSNVENDPRQWPVAGQPATSTSHVRCAILRTPPSHAGHRPAVCTHPTDCSHYVVISLDGRKLVTRVRVMLP